jgi:hypothetical protein
MTKSWTMRGLQDGKNQKMKTDIGHVYSELEMLVIQDIQDWALQKYGEEFVEDCNYPSLSQLIQEYWKEKLE